MTPDDETPNVGTPGHPDWKTQPSETNDDTVMMKSDEEVSDVTEASPPSEDMNTSEPTPKKKLGLGGIMKALSNAVRNGHLSSRQARQMRSDLGILGSFFTKPSNNVKAKRAKRLAAKKARKVTYRNGYKGQKMNKGGKR